MAIGGNNKQNAVLLTVSTEAGSHLEFENTRIKHKRQLISPNNQQLLSGLKSLLKSKAAFACFHFCGASTPDGLLLLADGSTLSFDQFVTLLKWYSKRRLLFGSRNPHKHVLLVLDTQYAGGWVDSMSMLETWEKEELRFGILTYRNSSGGPTECPYMFSRLLLGDPHSKELAMMYPQLQTTALFDLAGSTAQLGMDVDHLMSGHVPATKRSSLALDIGPMEPPGEMPSAVRCLLNVLPWERSNSFAFKKHYRVLSLGPTDLNPLFRNQHLSLSSTVLPERVSNVDDLAEGAGKGEDSGRRSISPVSTQEYGSDRDDDSSVGSFSISHTSTPTSYHTARGLSGCSFSSRLASNSSTSPWASREHSAHQLLIEDSGNALQLASSPKQRHRLAGGPSSP